MQHCLLLVSFFSLGAIGADQLAARFLFSSSPLWAVAAFALLVWRRGDAVKESDSTQTITLSLSRIMLFVAAHLLLVVFAKAFGATLQPHAGTLTLAGWLVAALKFSVLLPSAVLLTVDQWHSVLRTYSAEMLAGLIVLLTFFPSRFLDALWPWYGQALGRTVFHVAKVFVSSLIYIKAFSPVLFGPGLSVTILPSCSGINGIELFDYLFGFVVLVDWNRLRKVPALLGYFGGLAAILLGNVLRICSFVIFGNRGFADFVAQFHISAGWIFFSLIFLLYLSATYRWLIRAPSAA